MDVKLWDGGLALFQSDQYQNSYYFSCKHQEDCALFIHPRYLRWCFGASNSNPLIKNFIILSW